MFLKMRTLERIALQKRAARGLGAGWEAERWLAMCGRLAGPLWFGAVALAGMLQPGSQPLAEPVSFLGARGAPFAGWLNAALAVCGLLVAGFAWGLWRRLGPGPYSWWGPLLIGLFGLIGLMGTALLPCQPGCVDAGWGQQWHYAAAVIGGASALWGLISLVEPLAAQGWARQARGTQWAAHLCFGLVLLFDLASTEGYEALGAYRGLIQRLFFAALFGWMWWMGREWRKEVRGRGGRVKLLRLWGIERKIGRRVRGESQN